MTLSSSLVTLSLLVGAAAQGTSKDYPPGWNGEATTPPMGWRSWNAFGANIKNDTFVQAISALTAKVWSVDGKMVSFADVGYSRVGIDEGWENCSGSAPNDGMRQHDELGFPMVNSDKFPDLKWLVDYGHRAGVQMGWYLNGCACGERKERAVNYQGDVQRLHEYGFDAVKLDGCGAATNMTRYAELMAATGRTYEIENCHWGHCGEDAWFHNPDGSSCPTASWCPFNHYRTSGDINAGLTSWLANLQTTTKFQDAEAPLSVPGCWAYPDMMEVGRIKGGDVTWSRAHFGAWCVVSAPLILGLDVTDHATLATIAPFLTNPEAIAVNQQWAGHPGRKVLDFGDASLPAASGLGTHTTEHTAGTEGLRVEHAHGDGLHFGPRTSSMPAAPLDASGFTVQVWIKPQPKGKLAVYVVNPTPNGTDVAVDFATLGLGAEVTGVGVRDLWARKDLGDAKGRLLTTSVPSMDSVFLLLTPQQPTALPLVEAA